MNQTTPELVLSDINMPQMSGLDGSGRNVLTSPISPQVLRGSLTCLKTWFNIKRPELARSTSCLEAYPRVSPGASGLDEWLCERDGSYV
jgi:hypothetical protein